MTVLSISRVPEKDRLRALAMFAVLIAVGVLLALIVHGCSGLGNHDPYRSEIRVKGVVRIFMSSPHNFYVMRRVNSNSFIMEQLTTNDGAATFVEGLPPEEDMYVVRKDTDKDGWTNDLIFYIHSPADINGAGWNHGKGRSGTTVPIE